METTIYGKRIPIKRNILRALCCIQGIGIKNASKICRAERLNPNAMFRDISRIESKYIEKIIKKNFIVEEKLRKDLRENINNILGMRTYRATRHRAGLPVRGQRTHTNKQTQKLLSTWRLSFKKYQPKQESKYKKLKKKNDFKQKKQTKK